MLSGFFRMAHLGRCIALFTIVPEGGRRRVISDKITRAWITPVRHIVLCIREKFTVLGP